jgi:hypothetical protein
MDKEEWHERYMKHIQTKAALTRIQAKDTLNAGMGEYDYNDAPEDAADEELSYWTNDG